MDRHSAPPPVPAPAAGASPGTTAPLPFAGGTRPQMRVVVMDCPFDLVTPEEAVERAAAWCHREGARSPHTIMTVNAALLVGMRNDPALARACQRGDLIVPDGVPVVWASRAIGTPLRARVAGVDLMAAILARGATQGLRVFFLGARPEVVRALVDSCAARYPGLVVAGHRDGYFDESQHQAVIAQIRESNADVLFVGMPSPFKEVWSERHRDALGVPVIMGVGGSFDVLAGFIRRAPAVFQKVGLEWFWRLLMEPRKLWKRYLVTNTLFLARTAREVVRHRLRRGGRPPAGAAS